MKNSARIELGKQVNPFVGECRPHTTYKANGSQTMDHHILFVMPICAWGTQAYAALKSLVDISALAGIAPFGIIQNLLGLPALPVQV